MNPVILYRRDFFSQPFSDSELEVAKKHFHCVEQRTEIEKGSLVICRYSALPYFRELEKDIENLGGQILNSYRQHKWIANFDYYEDIKDYTFPSWPDSEYPLCGYNGPVVVKGRTNSKKFQWNTHMYAENRKEAIRIIIELSKDSLLGTQGLIIRQYIPLKTFEIGINGLRFTNEFRFFMLKENVLSYGYYWSSADKLESAEINDDAFELVRKVARICAENMNFYVIDIAQKEDGNWIVVELNDGFMSGLSENDPDTLYSNLKKELQS